MAKKKSRAQTQSVISMVSDVSVIIMLKGAAGYTLNMRSQEEIITKAIEKHCKNKKVLDLGCGDFYYTLKAQEAGAKTLFALDTYLQRGPPGVFYFTGDAQGTIFTGTFEVILFLGVLSYVNLEKMMKELNRLLSPQGIIILHIKDSRGLKHKLYSFYCGLRRRKKPVHNYNKVKKEIGKYFEILDEQSTKPKHNSFFILQKKL